MTGYTHLDASEGSSDNEKDLSKMSAQATPTLDLLRAERQQQQEGLERMRYEQERRQLLEELLLLHVQRLECERQLKQPVAQPA
ncbi:hypothetical protein BGZ80_010203, partial [Entomortierella chlamydospora]